MAEEKAPHTWQSLLALLDSLGIKSDFSADTHEATSIREDTITATLATLEVFDALPSAEQFQARCDTVTKLRFVLKNSFKGKPDLHARIVLTAVLHFACTKILKTYDNSAILAWIEELHQVGLMLGKLMLQAPKQFVTTISTTKEQTDDHLIAYLLESTGDTNLKNYLETGQKPNLHWAGANDVPISIFERMPQLDPSRCLWSKTHMSLLHPATYELFSNDNWRVLQLLKIVAAMQATGRRPNGACLKRDLLVVLQSLWCQCHSSRQAFSCFCSILRWILESNDLAEDDDCRLDGVEYFCGSISRLICESDPYEDDELTAQDIQRNAPFLIMQTGSLDVAACQILMQGIADIIEEPRSEYDAAAQIAFVSKHISDTRPQVKADRFPKLRLASKITQSSNFNTFAFLCDLLERNILANKADNATSTVYQAHIPSSKATLQLRKLHKLTETINKSMALEERSATDLVDQLRAIDPLQGRQALQAMLDRATSNSKFTALVLGLPQFDGTGDMEDAQSHGAQAFEPHQLKKSTGERCEHLLLLVRQAGRAGDLSSAWSIDQILDHLRDVCTGCIDDMYVSYLASIMWTRLTCIRMNCVQSNPVSNEPVYNEASEVLSVFDREIVALYASLITNGPSLVSFAKFDPLRDVNPLKQQYVGMCKSHLAHADISSDEYLRQAVLYRLKEAQPLEYASQEERKSAENKSAKKNLAAVEAAAKLVAEFDMYKQLNADKRPKAMRAYEMAMKGIMETNLIEHGNSEIEMGIFYGLGRIAETMQRDPSSFFKGRTAHSKGLLEQCDAYMEAKRTAMDAAKAELQATNDPVAAAMEAPAHLSVWYCKAAYDTMLLCRAKAITNTLRTVYGQMVREAHENQR